jgi:hypothetical protein
MEYLLFWPNTLVQVLAFDSLKMSDHFLILLILIFILIELLFCLFWFFDWVVAFLGNALFV